MNISTYLFIMHVKHIKDRETESRVGKNRIKKKKNKTCEIKRHIFTS